MGDNSEMQLDDEDSSILELESPNLTKNQMDRLKISISNSGEEDPSVAFIKTEIGLEDDYVLAQPDVNTKFKVTLTQEQQKQSLYQSNAKLYKNTAAGDFTFGVDITSEDSRKRRKERAKRFGLSEQTIADRKLDINSLYLSLGVSEDDLERTGERQIRRDTIVLRGVDHLNTQDIFKYLAKYPPQNLEWIDDSSCNLVYGTIADANRTLIAMSEPINTSLVPLKPIGRQSSLTKPGSIQPATSAQTGCMAADKDSVESSRLKKTDDTIDLLSAPTDVHDSRVTASATEMVLEDESGSDNSGVYLDESVVPPGKWRVATGSDLKVKGKLFMRLATKADVKAKGAERKSQYYRRHGNPNYGGLPGLISKSKKHRFRKEQSRILEREAKDAVSDGGRSKIIYDSEDIFGTGYKEEENGARVKIPAMDVERQSIFDIRKRGRQLTEDVSADSSEICSKKSKPMMKMAADEEAKKVERIRAQSKAIMASLDVRQKLDGRRHDSYLRSLQQRSMKESTTIDLRSRLKQRNNW
ncbi:nuclear cap-binding protein subunit 3-like [Watersipora subatra]|uniref:nuclear cap-binding protein subunit 3-like n=1 Tax=Watersipora subatra TaxID=2589382 RepID=UPI00355AD7A6